MEKKKTLRTIKVLGSAIYLAVFLALLAVEVQAKISGSGFAVSFLIYWVVLFGWIGLVWNFKWKSSASLIPAFILFALAALLTTIGLKVAGETVMRLSFIGWLMGMVQALVEYKKNEKG